MCYALLGPEHRDVRKLCKLGGQDCSNGSFECNVLYRLLSNLDALEQVVIGLGTWVNERMLGTDDLENLFSELTRRCGGYMPSVQVLLQMSPRALWDTDVVQHVSKKRRYSVMSMDKRAEWNDGQRCPVFWPLEINAHYSGKEVQPDKRQRHEGVKAGTYKPQSVRSQHSGAAQAKKAAAAREPTATCT